MTICIPPGGLVSSVAGMEDLSLWSFLFTSRPSS